MPGYNGICAWRDIRIWLLMREQVKVNKLSGKIFTQSTKVSLIVLLNYVLLLFDLDRIIKIYAFLT